MVKLLSVRGCSVRGIFGRSVSQNRGVILYLVQNVVFTPGSGDIMLFEDSIYSGL